MSSLTIHLGIIAKKRTPQITFNIDILRSYGYVVIPHEILNLRFNSGNQKDHAKIDLEQCEARNKYLDVIPDGELLLILDDDEVITGSLNILPIIYETMVFNNMHTAFISEILPDGRLKPRPRIIRKKAGMTYYWKHDMIIVPTEVSEDLLFYPATLYEDPLLNQRHNYIHPERKRSLIVRHIHIAHFKDLINIEVDKSSRSQQKLPNTEITKQQPTSPTP